MAKFSVKVTREPQLGAPRFTRSEMREIVQAVRDGVVDVIHDGRLPDLSPAKPLNRGYAISKSKKTGRAAFRDWRLKADIAETAVVTVSDASVGLIKFPAATVRLALIRETQDSMFALSRISEAAGFDVAQKYLAKALARAVK